MAARHLSALAALWLPLAAAAAAPGQGSVSVADAMPPATVEALFLEPLQRMDPAMTGLSSALGESFALTFSEMAPLPNLVLQGQARGDPAKLGLNPSGGLGLFRVEGYPAAVGVVAVSDELRAMDALMRKLRGDGAELLGSSREGVELQVPTQAPVMAFCHGGFLYLVMADEMSGRPVNRALAAVVRDAPDTGLGGTPLWLKLSSKLDRTGAVVFFRRRPLAQMPDLLGVALAIRPQADRLAVNGFAVTARPLAPGVPLPSRDLLENAPGTPAVVFTSHLGPAVLRALLLGDASTPGGVLLPDWLGLGPEAGELAPAVGGGMDALAYTRASLARGEGGAGDEDSAVLWTASLQDAAAADAALEHRARRRAAGEDFSLWRMRIRKGVLSGAVGPSPSGPPHDVLAELTRRFGGGAFGPGHLSLYVDLPLLRESFLDDGLVPPLLPRGHFLFLDAAAADGGLAVRGELSLLGDGDALGAR